MQALRGKVVWVDDGTKYVGYGENHPTVDNTIDGTRSQADRRVEVFLFDEGDAPDLAAFNGADVYDGVTFEKEAVKAMPTARRPNHFDVHVRNIGALTTSVRLWTDWGFEQTQSTSGATRDASGLYCIRFTKLPDSGLFSIEYRNASQAGVEVISDVPFAMLTAAPGASVASAPPTQVPTTSVEDVDYDPQSYLDDYTVI